ncbi:MAG: HRDC domain-containing protein [Phycisphaerales bacterium]|nr:MAG: HRDC domain-containing protein [Phycisphaerales bacterium]
MQRRRGGPEATLIESQSQISQFCQRCGDEGRFAFDTEFVMEDRYESEVCLLQAAVADSVVIIDPFSKLDLSPLWGLVANDAIETVVHAGQEDLAIAVQYTEVAPRRVFDVQIAAGLVGFDYPISLQRLIQSMLHIRLHKAKTLTDWRKRPLTQAQIRYAAEDVAYLLTIREDLNKKLESLGRLDWAREEFRCLEELTRYRRAEEDRLLRIKGMGNLKSEKLAVAREIMHWRETLAKRLNRPARVVLKDHLLVEIAKHGLAEVSDIRDLRGMNLNQRNIHSLVEVIRNARKIPSSEWPEQKPRSVDAPRDAALLALVTAVARSYCLEHKLAYGLVATQKSIRELIRHSAFGRPSDGTGVELLAGWRGETVGAMLADVLAGKRTVRVEELDGERTVRVTRRRDKKRT